MSDKSQSSSLPNQAPPPIAFRPGDPVLVPTHPDILTSDPVQFIAKFTDIAANNLACAVGLPGTDELDIPKMLALLDQMAARARGWTEKNWRVFDLKPAEFNNSKNVYRALTMTHVIYKHFGIHYNPDRLRDGERGGGTDLSKLDEGDAGDSFIHAALGSRKTGVCGTLPVLTVAVGRRLGYPLYLVKLPNHLFCRWHDEHERFNIENTGQGSCIHPDEYYFTWPTKLDLEALGDSAEGYRPLDSMGAEFEMARFISSRVIVLRHYGWYKESLEWIDALERFHKLPYDEWRLDGLARAQADTQPAVWGARVSEPPKLTFAVPVGKIVTSLSPLSTQVRSQNR